MVVFKQMSDFKKDGTKYNKQDYMYYTNYIATRDGAVYGDELDHGLFGKYGDMEQSADIGNLRDAESYVGNIYDDGKEIYRCVISLTEDEAAEFGYTNREKWTELLNSKIFDIGEEYHIKYADLEYMASVHFEPGYPHVQFNFWDKNQTIKNKIISKPQFEKRTERVRACLAKEVYKDNIRDILQSKEQQDKTVVSGFNAFVRGISQQELAAAELNLKSIFPELCEEKMLNIKDMDDCYLSFVYEEMRKVEQSILEHYPKGALKYKYLPSECKETLNSLTDTILQHPDFRKEFNHYLHSVKLYSTALGNGSKTIADTQRKAVKEMYKKFGNRILNNLKENIHLPTRGGVDIVINEALDAASIFDQRIINLCDDNLVFHLEDLDGNNRIQWRVSKLEKLGAITNYGMRYEVSQEFAEKVKELVCNFKQNKLWGIDRHFVELKQFTLDDLKGHPKNSKGKMEKRLPLLLITGLIEEKDGAYVITKEYRELYKAQLERYKQEQFENWFKENIDNDVTISIYDGVFLRMGENGTFTRMDFEQADNSSKTEFRLRRLVAEDYILNDGNTFTLTEKFRDEICAKLEEFKSRLYRVDKAFVQLECFTMVDIQASEENRKKNEMDELGAMEKRLPALLATGFVLEQDGVYMVSDEYRTAVLTSTADYHQKNFDEKNQAQNPNISRLNLFDSEFLSIATTDNQFSQAEVEQHNESGRLDWRLRQLIGSGLIKADGIQYTLSDRFLKKIAFTQRQFEKNFKVEYKDSAFERLAVDGCISKEALLSHKNSGYLKWRIYGLQYKELIQFDGSTYSLTDKFYENIAYGKEKYCKTFQVRLVDKLFQKLGNEFTMQDIAAHPQADQLIGRLEGLQYKGFINFDGKSYSITEELKQQVQNCSENFTFKASDGALLKFMESEKTDIPKTAIENDFRYDWLEIHLQEFLVKGYAKENDNAYILTKDAVEGIKEAIQSSMGEFRLRYVDSNFLEFDSCFTLDDVECHKEGLFLADRIRALVKNGYLEAEDDHYTVTDKLFNELEELDESVEPNAFDVNLLRMADEDNIILHSTISELESPIRTEYRLQDLICKGYVTHNGDGYLLEDDFVEQVNDCYEEFKSHFLVQPYDDSFIQLSKEDVLEEKALSTMDDFNKKRLSSLLLIEYVKKEDDHYVISDILKQEVSEAKESFAINHFDYDIVRLADGNGKVPFDAVLNSANGEYLERRVYSLMAMGEITSDDGGLILTQHFCNEAKLAHEQFDAHFKISSYDLKFLQLNGTLVFSKEQLKQDEDFVYLSSRLRSLVQQGFVSRLDEDTYKISDDLITDAQKAFDEFELLYSDIRFLRINGTNQFTDEEIDYNYSKRIRELMQQGCINKSEDAYSMGEKFATDVKALYDEFKENLIIQPYDDYFVTCAKDGSFRLEDLEENELFSSRLYTLLLLEYIKKDGEQYAVTEELIGAVSKAKQEFSINHFDYDIVKLADEEQRVSLDAVLSSANGEYLERRVYSLMAMGEITSDDGGLILTQHFCNEAKLAHEQFDAHFKISSYDLKFLQLNGTLVFSKEELKQDEDFVYLSSRLRSLVQQGFVSRLDEHTYKISDDLITDAQKAFDEFELLYSDIRFLRINGTNQFTDEEVDYSFSKRLRELKQQGCINKSENAYSMGEKFVTDVQALYDEFKENLIIQPYDDYFVSLTQDGGFQLEDLEENELFSSRLYTLLLLEYIKKDGEQYAVTEELIGAVSKAKQEFSINHFDYDIVKLADGNGKVSFDEVLNSANGEYLERRVYSLMAMGEITSDDGELMLTQHFCNEAKLAHEQFDAHFKISSYDLKFLQLNGTLVFFKEELKQDEDFVYLSSRLRSLVQQGFVSRLDEDTYKISDDLITDAQKAFDEFELLYSDIRFLRINGTNQFTDEEIDYSFSKRLRELMQQGCINKSEDNIYSMPAQFTEKIQTLYDEFKEDFTIQPCDGYFTAWAKDGSFRLENLNQNEFFTNRLYSLLLLEYIKTDGEQYVVTEKLKNAVTQSRQEFSFNHFDIEFVKLADKYGNLTVTDVLSNINSDYLEKRMYSLIATGHIRIQGDRIHLPREFICAANQCAQSYLSTFKVNCYDYEFLKLGTKFNKEQLEKHEDSLYLKSRLRSLLQKNLIWFDGKDYNINPLLAPSVDVAIKRFEIKGTDNRFLQINGTDTFTQKEADAHFELGARLRDLCSTGWITKTNDNYTISEGMKRHIKWHTAEFAQTKIGIWDLPFRSLAYPQGFTKADLKVRFSEQYEALSNRLDYLHANDLFEKIGERYFIKQPLLIGIERAEQVQRGFRRQAAVSLLMDVYKLFSKTVNQENLSRSNKRKHFKDMSEEAKKDMAAEQASAGTSWEEYER